MWERSSEPTGHGSLVVDGSEKLGGGDKSEDKNEGTGKGVTRGLETGQMCWRDKTLLRKLLQLRLDVVAKQWKVAKAKLSEVMRGMAMVMTREEVKKSWLEVQTVTREVWRREHQSNQRKVHHLLEKSRDCRRHRRCRDLDKLVGDRIASWVGRSTVGSGPGPAGEGVHE